VGNSFCGLETQEWLWGSGDSLAGGNHFRNPLKWDMLRSIWNQLAA